MEEMVYQIDPEFNEIMEELSAEDYRELEDSLLADGFKGAPIMVWNGIIIDGHNRYSICKKYNIPFEVKELNFQSRDEIIPWMVRAQLGRRNLTSFQRIKLVEKYRPIYEKQARENQLSGLKQNQDTVLKNSAKREDTQKDLVSESKIDKSKTPIMPNQKIDVRARLASDAAVSTDTYSKGKKILDSDNEDVKEKVSSGELSINAGYKEIKAAQLLPNNIPNSVQTNVEPIDSEEIIRIKSRYQEFLTVFQSDIKYLTSKQFIADDEYVTSKIHSDLRNCIENFSNIKSLMENMNIDEFDNETIIIDK